MRCLEMKEKEGYYLSQIDGVLFDMDHTLVKLHVDWEEVRREVNELLEQPVDSLWNLALPPWRNDYLAHKKEIDGIFRKYEMDASYDVLPMADLARLLPYMGILSNNTHAALERICRELGLRPKVIIGRDDVMLPKPAAAPALRAKRYFRKPIFIGDHPYDAITAMEGGIGFFPVQWGREIIQRFLLR